MSELTNDNNTSNSFHRLPSDVVIHGIASYVVNRDLLASASCNKDLLAMFGNVLKQRKQSKRDCKEIRKIFKQLRYILRYKRNPIRISSLPEDEYDLYFNDFLMEAKNNPPITVAFIESVEDNGWGSQLTNSSHKENIAKLLNDLFIQDRANFKDPQVLNQLGLAAKPSKNFPHRLAFPFSLACFTAAYILDRSFFLRNAISSKLTR